MANSHAWGALSTVVAAVRGAAGDLERLAQPTGSVGILQAAPGSAEPGPGPGLQMLSHGRHLSLPVQWGPTTTVWGGALGLDDQPYPR